MSAVHSETYSAARAHLKDLLDAAGHGRPATVRRDAQWAAIVDAARLRRAMAQLRPSLAEVVAEAGGWSAFLPGLPIAGQGDTFDDAVADLVDALREYAHSWSDHLSTAPNHAENWGLVQLIELSDDEQLRGWILGTSG
jgi:predicted RNase H-like HicB family nuclease